MLFGAGEVFPSWVGPACSVIGVIIAILTAGFRVSFAVAKYGSNIAAQLNTLITEFRIHVVSDEKEFTDTRRAIEKIGDKVSEIDTAQVATHETVKEHGRRIQVHSDALSLKVRPATT